MGWPNRTSFGNVYGPRSFIVSPQLVEAKEGSFITCTCPWSSPALIKHPRARVGSSSSHTPGPSDVGTSTRSVLRTSGILVSPIRKFSPYARVEDDETHASKAHVVAICSRKAWEPSRGGRIASHPGICNVNRVRSSCLTGGLAPTPGVYL